MSKRNRREFPQKNPTISCDESKKIDSEKLDDTFIKAVSMSTSSRDMINGIPTPKQVKFQSPV